MALHNRPLMVGRRVPDPHCSVTAPGGEQGPVVEDKRADAGNPVGVPMQGQPQGPLCRIPDPHRLVIATRSEQRAAIKNERADAGDPARVALKRRSLAAILSVPGPNDTITPAAGE